MVPGENGSRLPMCLTQRDMRRYSREGKKIKKGKKKIRLISLEHLLSRSSEENKQNGCHSSVIGDKRAKTLPPGHRDGARYEVQPRISKVVWAFLPRLASSRRGCHPSSSGYPDRQRRHYCWDMKGGGLQAGDVSKPHQSRDVGAMQSAISLWCRADVVQVLHTANGENTRLCLCGSKCCSRAGWLSPKCEIKGNGSESEDQRGRAAFWVVYQPACFLQQQNQTFFDAPLRVLIRQSQRICPTNNSFNAPALLLMRLSCGPVTFQDKCGGLIATDLFSLHNGPPPGSKPRLF